MDGGILYLHLNEFVYVTFYNDSIIFLNAITNEFKIYVGEKYQFLKALFNSEALPIENLIKDKDLPKLAVLKNMINLGLIKKHAENKPYPVKIDIKIDSKGCDKAFFKLPTDTFCITKKYNSVALLKCMWILFKIHRISDKKHFEGIIKFLQNEKSKRQQYVIPSSEELAELSAHLNHASLFYFKKTKCLEWSAAFVALALTKGWKCNVVVGVANFPFLSHAWVECENSVIADTETLSENLAKILSEPFGLK